MSSDHLNSRVPQLLGHALLFGCATAALWLAAVGIVPSAEYLMQSHAIRVPAILAPAFAIQRACYLAAVPISVAGGVLLVVSLLGRGPRRLVAASRATLAMLSILVACVSLYVLSCAGVGFKLASVEEEAETQFFKRTLDQFALLEAAQGRYDQLRKEFLKQRDLKMVEVRSASEFDDPEARERISTLIAALPKATDNEMKRRILATLCLFRERFHNDAYQARDLPRYATEAGAPQTNSPVETLEWIATTLHKDGWEPVPLIKLGR